MVDFFIDFETSRGGNDRRRRVFIQLKNKSGVKTRLPLTYSLTSANIAVVGWIKTTHRSGDERQ